MKIKLKTLSDKITAVVLYLLCMTIVISLFLEVSYMADYGFYSKVGNSQDTFYKLMAEKVDKEYSDIEKFVLTTFEKEAHEKMQKSNLDNGIETNDEGTTDDNVVYKSLREKYTDQEKTNLIIVATSNNKMYTR